MNNKEISKILGRANGLERASKDSDGDGVINSLDCEPYNKDKQGVIHNIGKRFKESRLAASQKRAAEAQIRSKARAAYYKEKEQQDIRAAKARAKAEADRKIEYHKKGGLVGQIGRGVAGVATATTKSVKAVSKSTKPKRATKKRKGKKRTSSSKMSNDIFGGNFI